MKNKKLFQKIVFITLIVLILFSLVAPAIFSQSLSAPRQEKLLNGLKVLMWSDARADKVTVKIRVHAGSAFDPQGKEGVMQMLADNIFPNQVTRDFFTEDLGGSLEIVTNYDYIQVNASSKPENFLTMLETLSTAVANPAIDKETTIKLRNALLAKIATLETDPAYVADQAVAKRLFGTFPYGRPQLGTTSSVQKLDFADLIDAKQRFLTADNATIAVSGNFDKALGYKAIRRYFGGWLKSDKKVPSTFRQPDAPPEGLQTISSPRADTAIRFAIRGASRSEKDFAAARVISSILESRLKARISADQASDIFARSEAYTLPGYIIMGFSAGKRKIGTGDGKINAKYIVSKAMSDLVTDEEFQAARLVDAGTWNKRDSNIFWLDNDTYKTLSVESDRVAFDNLTLSDLRAYVEKLRKATMVSVFVDTPFVVD